jgi:multiple sugar transport system permease protein
MKPEELQKKKAAQLNQDDPLYYLKVIGRYFKKNWEGLLYVTPVILGILFFTVLPMVTSMYDSFFKYDGITEREWNNFRNYIRPFTDDWDVFGKSLGVTFLYSFINIPLTMALSFLLALFLNKKLKGIKVFRTLYYLPVVIPGVISGLLWRNFTDVNYGLANKILTEIGFSPFAFLTSKDTAMITFIFLNMFGLGGGMVLWIASLNGISPELYEACDLEGANGWQKLIYITVPMCSPMIFYNLIMGIIGSLQTFGGVLVLTGGNAGPKNSLLFFVINIYFTAFSSSPSIGYASALSWILFVIIGIFTLLVFKTSKWVFYGEDA